MMEHSIKDERQDLEEHWPIVPAREIAQFLLERIVGDVKMAQDVWNAVVGPLYDLREVEARWPRGRCACGAVHPRWRAQHPGLKSEASRGHRMWCRWYVGPLKHQDRGERPGFASGEPMTSCTCGQTYYKWSDDGWTKRAACPEMLFVWRGPRPEEKEVITMSEPILEPQPQRKEEEPEPTGDGK